MKRLTSMEWATAKEPISHLSLPFGLDGQRGNLIAWLETKPGDGWFYTSGANFHFGSVNDATAFRRWIMARHEQA